MTERLQIGDRVLVIFDGHCGLCNRSVRWLLRRDRGDRLRFAASKSAKVAGLLARHGFGRGDAASGPDSSSGLGTMLVVRDAGGAAEKVLVRSDGVVEALKELPLPWPWFGAALSWIPRGARDLGYRAVARWRYRIWGRVEGCALPGAGERERFL